MTKIELLSHLATALLGATTEQERDGLDDDQNAALARAIECVNRYGGVLIADGVGSGKTRVASSVADVLTRGVLRRRVWICAPSRVRELWKREVDQTAPMLRYSFVSHHAMSFDNVPMEVPELIVVDEAHRFINASKRRRVLERFPTVPKILLTATPFVNRQEDLISLLKLFVDSNDVRRLTGIDFRRDISTDNLVALVSLMSIRRRSNRRPELSMIEHRYDLSEDATRLWSRLGAVFAELSWTALEEWPRHLAIEHFRRRYEWGIDALRASLSDLIRYFRQWVIAAERGYRLPKKMFTQLFPTDQQPFDFIYPRQDSPTLFDIEHVVRDLDRVSSLAKDIGQIEDSRFSHVDRIVARQKTLVFCSQVAVAHALFTYLRSRHHRVGLITGKRSQLSGIGRSTGGDVLRRFASTSNLRVDVLVATDCLSEGVNLRHCEDVVLLDTPQTPLVIEQRIGRIVRRDSETKSVRAHLFRPHDWNRTFGLRTRVEDKSARAAEAGFAYEFDRGPDSNGPLEALTVLDQFRTTTTGNAKVLQLESPRFSGWLACGTVDCSEVRVPLLIGIDGRGGLVDQSWGDLLAFLEQSEPATFDIPSAIEIEIDREVQRRSSCRLVPQRVRVDDPALILWSSLEQEGMATDALKAKLFGFQPRWIRAKLAETVNLPIEQVRRTVKALPEPISATPFNWTPVLWLRGMAS